MIVKITFYTDTDLIVYANKKSFQFGFKEDFSSDASEFTLQFYNDNTSEKDIAKNKELVYEFLNHISVETNFHKLHLKDIYENALKEFIALNKLTDFCYENGNQEFTFKIL